MASSGGPSAVEEEQSSDQSDAQEDLWTSPSKSVPPPQRNAQPRNRGTLHGKQEARDAALRRELQSVRNANEAIEGAIESLAKARNSIEVGFKSSIAKWTLLHMQVNVTRSKRTDLSQTFKTIVSSALSLLSIWTKILSQTEHNQRLILNRDWQGASQDLMAAEQETLLKQQAAERRQNEEEERRAAAARKAEEDECRRAEAATRVPKGTSRGRGRGFGRAGGTNALSSTSYVGVGGQGGRRGVGRGSSTARRTTSGIGRGTASVRGKSRE